MTVEELMRIPIELWDVSKVTNMSWMFECATSFNQDLSSWSPKLHPNVKVAGMFIGTRLEGNEPSWYLEIISKLRYSKVLKT